MPVHNAFRDTALGACLLLATLTWPALPAHAQTAVPPIVTPSPATLEARDIGPSGSATQSFSVNAPEGVEFVSLLPAGGGREIFRNGTTDDGGSTWRLDSRDCEGFPTSCTFVVEYIAGDDTPRTARLRVSSSSDVGPETDVTLTGTLGSRAEPGQASLVRITDPVSEGGTLDIVVERTGGSDGTLVAFFGDEPGTADTSDYQILSPSDRQLTWDDGDTRPRTITVLANADALDEGAETFDFLLASQGDFFDQSGTVTILDVPPPATGFATFATPADSVSEGSTLDITVERTGGSAGELNAFFDPENISASDDDYEILSPSDGTFFWADGDVSPRTITVRAFTDDLLDPDERFILFMDSDGDDGSEQSSDVTIVDVPPASTGLATFVEPDAEVFEGDTLELVVERSGGSDGPLNATLAIDDDTASNADYRVDPPAGGTLSWAAGDTSPRTVTVRALDDTAVDPDELFTLVLTSDGDDGSDQTSAVSIIDVPPPEPGNATFVDADGSVAEGDTLSLVVGRTGGSDGTLSVGVFGENDTASDADYRVVEPAGGTLTWLDGDVTTRTVVVEALTDALAEPDELLALRLGGDTDARPASRSTITVVEVPPAPTGLATFVEPDASVSEGATLDLVVERSGGSAGPLNASLSGLDGSASGTTDYRIIEPSGGTLNWVAGDTGTRTVTVEAFFDGVAEPDETFALQLTSDGDDDSVRSSAITIVDVTPPDPGEILFASDTGSLAEGETLEVVVNRVGGTAGVVERDVIGLTDTAVAADYRIVSPDSGLLAWTDGDDSSRTIVVEALTDALSEPSETFALLLRPPGPVVGGDGSSPFEETISITITDVPPAARETGTATFVDAGGSVTEGDTLDIVVARTDGTNGSLTASFAAMNGTAGEADYRIVSPDGGLLSWDDGDGSTRTITVEALTDDLVEPSETFELLLSNSGGEEFERSSTVTVLDATEPPESGTATFANLPASVTEGTTLDVVVTRDGGSDGTLAATLVTENGTAGEADYRVVSPMDGRLSWGDDDTSSRTVTVEALSDELVEPDESFALLLRGAGDEPSERSGTITVVDATVPPESGTAAFASTGGSLAEGTTLDVVVVRTGGSDGTLTVDLADAGVTADDADYRIVSPMDGMLSWGDGDTSTRTVTVEALADALVEPDETFELRLGGDGEGEDGAGSSTTITVLDVPPPESGTATFASAEGSLAEGTTLDVVVARTGGSDGTLVATFAAENGSATGADYRILSPDGDTLAWEDGDTSTRTIVVEALGDELIEADERFSLRLESDGGDEAVSSSTITVLDVTEPSPAGSAAFASTGGSVFEGDTLDIVVARTGGTNGPLTASVDLASGTASDDDVRIVSPDDGRLAWADGDDSSRTVTVEGLADDLREPDESLELLLVDDGEEGEEARSITITVLDATEPPAPDTAVFAAAETRAGEADGAVELVVRRVGTGLGDVSVGYRLEAGSAVPDSDYDASGGSGRLEWADGDTTERTVRVPIVADTAIEPEERFSVVLERPDGLVVGEPGTAVVILVDDDVPGTLAFDPERYAVSEADGSVTLSVARRGGSAGPATVSWRALDGTARAGDDYAAGDDGAIGGTLSWAADDAGSRAITLSVNADDLLEPDETFRVELSDASGAALGDDDVAVVTIGDSTVPPLDTLAFATDALEVGEADGDAVLIVRRTGSGIGAVTARYAIALGDGGEDASSDDLEDGAALSGTLSWSDGDTGERTIDLPVADDDAVEPDERLVVSLSEASGAAIGSPDTLVLTLVDDDVAPLAPGTLRFTVADPRVEESAGEIVVGVERTGGTDGELVVELATADDTALAGSDYTEIGDTLRWASGEDGVRTVTVPVLRDAEIEDDERFLVRLDDARADGRAVTLDVAELAVTVVDTTRVGRLVLADANLEALESASELVVRISRTGGSDGPMQIAYETVADSADGDALQPRNGPPRPATAGEDYRDVRGTLRWEDGEEGVREARIEIIDDALDEPDETFRLRFVDPLPAGTPVSGDGVVGITLLDDDETPVPLDDDSVEPLAELGSLRLVVFAGDEQSALPGDNLEPLVADVVDGARDDVPVPGVPVRWSVIPAGSAELLDGARTIADESGRVVNRVRVRSRGFLSVVAAIDVAAAPSATGTAPGEAMFRVLSGLAQQPGLSGNQVATGAALDTFCEILGEQIEGGEDVDAEGRDLFATCTELDARLVDDRLGASLDRLAPEELFAIGDSIIDTTDIQVTNVFARINAIRAARRGGVDLSGFDLDLYGERVPGSVVDAAGQAWGLGGGGSSADEDGPGSRLGVFVNGVVSLGTVDGDGVQRDADIATAGITVGADYRFTADTVAGIGLGLVVNETAFEADDGEVEAEGVNLTLFATRYTSNASYLDGVLDVGRNTYDIRRRINLPGLPDQFGLGETDADVLSLTVGGGKDLSRGAYEFGPYFRLTHTRASVDGYAERASVDGPGDGSVLDIRSHDIRSTRLALGGQVSRTVNTRRGVLVPQLRVETEIETEDRKDGIEASFRHDPERVPFTVNGNLRDTDGYVNLGLGTSAVFANGRSGYVFYETRAAHEYVTQHFLKAGFRLEF